MIFVGICNSLGRSGGREAILLIAYHFIVRYYKTIMGIVEKYLFLIQKLFAKFNLRMTMS